MGECVAYDISVLFAVITGTSATLLSLLMWSVFRQTPAGTAVFGLLVVMSIFTVQNGLVLLFSCEVFLVRLLKSGINTAMFAVVAYLLVSARGLGPQSLGGDRP
jgi:hypothetical protein